MKLVHPQEMARQQSRTLKLCFAQSYVAISSEEAIDSFATQASAVESGVTIVNRKFPIPKIGNVDLIATDMSSRPVLVFVCDALDAVTICRSFSCADWFADNHALMEHIAPDARWSGGARVWLFASSVSPDAGALLSRLHEPPEVFSYRGLSFGKETWIVIQEFMDIKRGQGTKLDIPTLKPHQLPVVDGSPGILKDVENSESLPFKSVLSEEEIGAFFETPELFDGDDEVTSRATLAAT